MRSKGARIGLPVSGGQGRKAVCSFCARARAVSTPLPLLCASPQVGPSTSNDIVSMQELQRWNEMYGEGGKRKADTLTYFL